jgi:hypothetical protein
MINAICPNHKNIVTIASRLILIFRKIIIAKKHNKASKSPKLDVNFIKSWTINKLSYDDAVEEFIFGIMTYIFTTKSIMHSGIKAISDVNNNFLECTFTFNFIQIPNIKPNIISNISFKLNVLKFQIIFDIKKRLSSKKMKTKIKNKTKYLFKFNINLPINGENKQSGIKAIINHHCENAY